MCCGTYLCPHLHTAPEFPWTTRLPQPAIGCDYSNPIQGSWINLERQRDFQIFPKIYLYVFFSVSLVTFSRSAKTGSLFPWQPPPPKWGCGHWIQGWDRAPWIYVTLTECWAFGAERSWSLDASTLSQSDSFASVVCSWAPQVLLHTWLETYSLQPWNIKERRKYTKQAFDFC